MFITKKLKMIGNMDRFSWAEALSTKDGKTSMLLTASLILTISGALVFMIASIAALFSVANALAVLGYDAFVLGLGASMLGVSKVVGGKPVMEDVINAPGGDVTTNISVGNQTSTENH